MTSVATLATLGVVAGTAYAGDTGVDVSGWQHGASLNWNKVKADGVDFAFVKATEGSSYTNPYLPGDWAATGKVGIYHGAYHFARPSVGSAVAQAKYFVSKAGLAGAAGDLPPVLDLEATGGLGVSALRTWTGNWLEEVQSLTGRTPMIYVSPYFWIDNLGNSTAFTKYPLWIAHYNVSKPMVPGGWSTWTFWQRTSTASVNGIAGHVDMNVFNGTSARLAKLALTDPGSGGGGTPTGPTTPTISASTTTLAASRTSAYAGQQVTMSGSLVSATNKAVPDRRVGLFRKPAGASAYHRVAVTTTAADGTFAFPVTVSTADSYFAHYRGGKLYKESRSARVSLTVLPRVTTAVDIHSNNKTTVVAGTAVTFYGHLTTTTGTAVVNRRVRLYQRLRGSSTWTQMAVGVSIAPTGWWQAGWVPVKGASYEAVFAGGVKNAPSSSAVITVPVT